MYQPHAGCSSSSSSSSKKQMMQRQFIVDDENAPITISLPEDSLISVQTSSDYLRGPKQDDWCEDNAFCIYPIVQTLIGLLDLGAFYMQWKLIKVNNEEKPDPLVSFPGQNIVCVSFLLSLIFQEAFLWLERDSKRTAIYATLSFIASIFVMSLVWFYQEQHGRAYTGGGTEAKVRGLFLFFLWLLFLVITIVYAVRLTRLTYHISQRERFSR
ncbi:uncharacterized protein LOC110848972 [Folsomia candida]|uniref:Uncharacterized protein n=1 Tax=Folsomia candida TaxID=158441 RepID=A0A226EEI5_FOLCA|nr:uncharacterized protein LOC110848972 [Folsomia candida]OXA55952.1 hypothetical protein Fcan01_08996 [Folsomia candida]